MKKSVLLLPLLFLLFFACKPNKNTIEKTKPQMQPPLAITYHLSSARQCLASFKNDSLKTNILYAVNRTDSTHFAKMDTVIVPDDVSGNLAYYLPFPLTVAYLQNIRKIIFFSYPAQIFAAYEKGELVYTGPTNMGRKKDPTPTGLFFTNWKAEKTISTFNDEWDLRWNFNIQNKEGIGWHQYALPGYPASHACLRLQEKDAKYLYTWADEWVITDKDSVAQKGTPVIVFGSYNFDAAKPWLQLIANPKAMDISEAKIEEQTTLYLSEILDQLKKQETYQLKKLK